MSRFKLCASFSLHCIVLFFSIYFSIFSKYVSTEETNKHIIDFNLNYIIIDSVCERQIESEKISCVADSVSAWNSVDNRQRAGCCISWDINDCILDAVYEKCDQFTYNRIKRLLDQQNKEHSKGLCGDYVYGSYKCHFPVWAIILIVIFGLLVVGGTAFLICMYCYHSQQTLKYF